MLEFTKYVEGTDMRCPMCNERLHLLDERRYETLSEHVSNPNGTPSLKKGFGCVNKDCEAHKTGARWLYDGEGPYGGDIPREKWHPKGTLHADIHKKYP